MPKKKREEEKRRRLRIYYRQLFTETVEPNPFLMDLTGECQKVDTSGKEN